MATSQKPCVLLLTLLLVFADHALGQRQETESQRRLSAARQCRMERFSVSRPSRRIQSEGGMTELWDENEDQFQCAGVAVMRNIIQSNCLSLPNYASTPRLVYIQQGQGLLGYTYPGCPETYRGGLQQEGMRDQHQKIHRIRKGDIVALPAGSAHWCYNDGNEELVALSVTDVNSNVNQLDRRPWSFYLAGGQPKGQKSLSDESNILRAFDENLLAEAFDISLDVVRKIQRDDERGYIVKVQKGEMRMVRPGQEQEQEEESQTRNTNGLEETYCNMRLNQYLDNPREADVYSRQAGRLNSVNKHKLPILKYLDMSAEKGNLMPNAIYAPHWTINAHTIFYVTEGEGRVQMVAHNGKTVFDDIVKEGDMLVVPQYYAIMKRAGSNGFQWVSFKTSALPMKSPLVGSSSAIKGMPLEVITNSYRMSYKEAQDLKYNREHHMMLFPPTTTRSS